MEASYTGTYTAIAALIVAGLAKFGIITQANDVVTIIAGLVALFGVLKQAADHKRLDVFASGMRG